MSKLLVIADIEDKCAATPRGLQLADEMDLQAEVIAFTWVNLKRLKVDAETAAQVKKQLISERKATIEKRVEQLRGPKHGVKIQIAWAEDIHTWVNKRVANQDYAAVVKSRHRSETLMHTSTDWHLLRECSVPVLLVSKKKWKKGSIVMATVDLDAGTKAKQKLNVDVVMTARHYAAMLGADIKVLCVIDVPVLLADLDLVDPKTYAKQRKEELAPALKALAEETGLPETAFKLKRGPVAETICSEAHDLSAQLVVMGTVGRKGVSARMMGNTSEEVLGLLRADTLTIKP